MIYVENCHDTYILTQVLFFRFSLSYGITQEDAHVVTLNVDAKEGLTESERTALFGVFDGHGGKEVARFVAAHLPDLLNSLQSYRTGNLDTALSESFLKMDELLIKSEFRDELNALKGSESDDDLKDGGENTDSGMTINSSQLPASLLEALGMTSSESGFVFRIVKSKNEDHREQDNDANTLEESEFEEKAAVSGANLNIQENQADEEEEDEEDDGSAVSDPSGASGAGKRKRNDGGPMIIDNENGVNTENVETLEELEIEEIVRTTETKWTGPAAGCTAVCAAIRNGKLVVANAGDSRCILSRGGTAVALTEDHKPTDPDEYARIAKAGGFVADGRVNGSLNLSRALGDLEYKQSKDLPPEEQMVTAAPDISQEELHEEDEFIILACDGIWDVLTNQDAVDFVRERLLIGSSPKEICEEMCDWCLAPDTSGCGKGCDNMSVIIVVLQNSNLARKAAAARTNR